MREKTPRESDSARQKYSRKLTVQSRKTGRKSQCEAETQEVTGNSVQKDT